MNISKKHIYMLITLFSVMFMLALGKSCAPEAAPEQSQSALEKTAERGPFSLRIALSKGELTTAETVEARCEALCPVTHRAHFPENASALGGFTVLSAADQEYQILSDGRIQQIRLYRLEPNLPGITKAGPFQVEFKGAADAEEASQTLETEAIEVNVTSVLPENPEERTFHDAALPMDPPRPWKKWSAHASWVLFLLTALGGLAWWIIRKKRDRSTPEAVRDPYMSALARLNELLAMEISDHETCKRFHLDVSDIMRRYLEERFGLRAPERTTEEFLQEAWRSPLLNADNRITLSQFLRRCDLVKFAEYSPSSEEIDETGSTCRRFIQEMEAAHGPAATAVSTPSPEEVKGEGDAL